MAKHVLPKQPGPEFFTELRERFEFGMDQDKEDRAAAEEDLRFAAGDQWDEKTRKARKKRPVLTENRLGPSIAQIVNDGRQNKPGILTMPLDGGTEETAEYYQGRIRQIEYESDADISYDTARETQVSCGRGFARLTTRYKRGNSGEQEAVIEPIRDPFSVVWDPSAKKYDLSDAGWMFVIDTISTEEHERRYGKNTLASKHSFYGSGENPATGWMGAKTVRIADYYVREQDEEGDWHVKIYVTNGVEILDETEWIGSTIGIIPFFGRQAVVDGKKQNVSLIRNSKDAQRLVNLYFSNIAEQISRVPKTPYLAAEGQLLGHEDEWAKVNEVEQAVLYYKTRDSEGNPAGPPTRNLQEPPIVALVRGYLQAIDSVKATMGIFDASLGANKDDTSGIAIARRQKEADVTNLHFADNEARSLKYLGKMLLEIIPLLDGFDPAQKPVRDEAGNITLVPINQPFADPQTGETVHHDLASGEYQVGIRKGPSYASQREQENERIGEVIKAAPELMFVMGDKYFETSDGPGAKGMAERMERFIKMKSPGLIEDKEDDPRAQLQQLSQKAQQLSEQNQQLSAAFAELQQAMNEKRVENETKIRIVAMQEETKRELAQLEAATKLSAVEITTKAQTSARMAADALAIEEAADQRAHDVGLRVMDQHHAMEARQVDAEQSDIARQRELEDRATEQQEQEPLAPAA